MNPFDGLADIFLDAAAKVWIRLMLLIWGAGLWVLRLELTLMDKFLTPDVSAGGPLAGIYPTTAWIGMSLASIMLVVQIGVSLIRRDGASLARIVLGTGQYVIVMTSFVVIATAVIQGCSAISQSLMDSVLNTKTWSSWSPFPGDYTFEDLTDAAAATVLAPLGCLLWLAGLGHILVMATRDVALILLVATAPISAAGLMSEVGKAWFWKTLRWFMASAFSAPLVVLVLGVGVQIATAAVGDTQGGDLMAQIATVIGAVLTICVSCVSPLALFRLLAFVDPATSSGAAMRAGIAASGGLQGVFGGGGSSSGTGAASSSEADGSSSGEASGQSATQSRFASALGPLGAGVGMFTQFGTSAASIGSDLSNQMGVGHGTYSPDMSAPRRKQQRDAIPSMDGPGGSSTPAGGGGMPGPGGGMPGGGAQAAGAGGSSAEAAAAAAAL